MASVALFLLQLASWLRLFLCAEFRSPWIQGSIKCHQFYQQGGYYAHVHLHIIHYVRIKFVCSTNDYVKCFNPYCNTY